MKSLNTMKRLDVEFESHGVICRGWHYLPNKPSSTSVPCIIMAHGLGGTKDVGLSPYAERFAQAGFHVVIFDYRHFGESDGFPRQLLAVKRQLQDWRSAIHFVRGLPEVNEEKIGLWGTSFSGGHVLTIAAEDSRIAAISSQNPMVDGRTSILKVIKHAGISQVFKMSIYGLLDLARSSMGLNPVTMPVVGKSGEFSAISSDEHYAAYKELVPASWVNEMTVRMCVTLPLYQPISMAKKIHCPVLLQPCMDDSIVSALSAVKLAKKLGANATLKKYFNMDHFDIYNGEGFEVAVSDQVDFFNREFT